MPVVLSHNDQLELNRVDYVGAVSMGELIALAQFNAANPQVLSCDCLNVVMPGAHFRTVDFTELDRLFAHYRELYAHLDFQIMRRGAWLCLSPEAAGHVGHWLGRDPRQHMSSEVRQLTSYEDATDWLVLSPDRTAMLENGEGFREIATFQDQPPLAAAG